MSNKKLSKLMKDFAISALACAMVLAPIMVSQNIKVVNAETITENVNTINKNNNNLRFVENNSKQILNFNSQNSTNKQTNLVYTNKQPNSQNKYTLKSREGIFKMHLRNNELMVVNNLNLSSKYQSIDMPKKFISDDTIYSNNTNSNNHNTSNNNHNTNKKNTNDEDHHNDHHDHHDEEDEDKEIDPNDNSKTYEDPHTNPEDKNDNIEEHDEPPEI